MPDIQTQSADGMIHSFPDGTKPEIIDKVMKDYATKSSAPFPGGPVPGAPGGVPPKMSAAPYPQELKAGGAGPPIDPISGQSMTQIQAQGPPGNILPAAGGVFGSVFGPGGSTLGAIAGEGLKQTLEPSANPPLEMLKSGGKMAVMEAVSPLVTRLLANKSMAKSMLEQASAKGGNAPITLSPKTEELIDKIVADSKSGGKLPKIISDLLDRLGPSTRIPAQAPPNPLTYDEARGFQKNLTGLTAEESQTMKGYGKYLMQRLANSFGEDVQAGANQAGIGAEHAGGMSEYAMASARNRALTKIGKYAAATGGAAALGGAGYAGFKVAKDVLMGK